MARLITSSDNHRERFRIWKARVNNMNTFEWPGSFKTNLNIEKSKYNRFTEYTKEWIHGILTNDESKQNDIHPSEFGDIHAERELMGNW